MIELSELKTLFQYQLKKKFRNKIILFKIIKLAIILIVFSFEKNEPLFAQSLETDDGMQSVFLPEDIRSRIGFQESEIRAMSSELKIPYGVLSTAIDGVELLISRRYSEANSLFQQITDKYPTLAIGPFGLMLYAQAKMSENLDFSQNDLFDYSYKLLMDRTNLAISNETSLAWNYFVRGCGHGIHGLFSFRKNDLWTMLQDGWNAVSDMKESRNLAPKFADPLLGLGIFDYWRTMMTGQRWYLSFLGDKKVEGVRQMEESRDQGVFTPLIAQVALAYSYFEDGKLPEAYSSAEEISNAYPSNIIALQLLGQIQARRGLYDQAKNYYEQVLVIDPSNYFTKYLLGNLEYKHSKDLERAKALISSFLESAKDDHPYLAAGNLRLGDIFWYFEDLNLADQYWKKALAINPDYKQAQFRLKGQKPPLKKKNYNLTNINVKPPYNKPEAQKTSIESAQLSDTLKNEPEQNSSQDKKATAK